MFTSSSPSLGTHSHIPHAEALSQVRHQDYVENNLFVQQHMPHVFAFLQDAFPHLRGAVPIPENDPGQLWGDVTLVFDDGRTETAEIKVASEPFGAIFWEEWDGLALGWGETSKADWLLYAFDWRDDPLDADMPDGLDVYLWRMNDVRRVVAQCRYDLQRCRPYRGEDRKRNGGGKQ